MALSDIRRNWVWILLAVGGLGIFFSVVALDCSAPILVGIWTFLGLGCISEPSVVSVLATALFALWLIALGVPFLLSFRPSK
jgi:hypothetical protein